MHFFQKHFHRTVILISLLFALAPSLAASVSIALSAGVLKDDGGHAQPQQALVLLVASTDGAFQGPVDGAFTRAEERIIHRADGTNLGQFGNGRVNFFAADLVLGNGWESGQRLALYWYPELTLAANAPAPGTPYGLFAPPPQSSPDGGQPWVTPADGSFISLRFFTTDLQADADHAPASGIAAFTAPGAGGGNGNGGGVTPPPNEGVFTAIRTRPGGWLLTDTLGWINGSQGAWLYAPALGFFRAFGDGEEAFWIYQPEAGWLWTGRAIYPYFYHWDSHRWRYLRDIGEVPAWYEYIPGSGWAML